MTKVERLLESGFVDPEPPRRYLGVSIIGKECPRQIWYMFRWYILEEKLTPRQRRLFDRGHDEEPKVHKALKKIGIKIVSKQESATLADGHISAHNDGILKNVPDDPKIQILNEIKTSKSTIFNKLIRIREQKDESQCSVALWDMTYYIQAIVYMYMFSLKKCLYIVVDKQTDARFYEIFKAKKKIAKHFLDRGVDIINSQTPPDKCGPVSYYKCAPKWCKFHFICHKKFKPSKTCRSCRHSEPVKKGAWSCGKKKKEISYKSQIKACKKYQVIKG